MYRKMSYLCTDSSSLITNVEASAFKIQMLVIFFFKKLVLQISASKIHYLGKVWGDRTVRCEEGLVIRPKDTTGAEQALKSQSPSYKKDYRTLQTDDEHLHGRPRHNACYRKRVGEKAALQCKVC